MNCMITAVRSLITGEFAYRGYLDIRKRGNILKVSEQIVR